jgi:hypothetical protein
VGADQTFFNIAAHSLAISIRRHSKPTAARSLENKGLASWNSNLSFAGQVLTVRSHPNTPGRAGQAT